MSVSSMDAASEAAPVAPAAVPGTEEVVTLEGHRAFMAAVLRGEHQVEEIKAGFDRLARSKVGVVGEISRMTVKELTRLVRPAYAGTRKPELIEKYWEELLLAFAWLTTGEKGVLTRQALGVKEDAVAVRQSFAATEEFVRSTLCVLTPERLREHLDYRARRAEEQRARWTAHLEALRDPKTIQDFTLLVEARGRDALTAEQRERYDALIANRELADRKATPVAIKVADPASGPSGATPVAAASQPTLELVQTRHTKKGHELFVVKLNVRVDRTVFDTLNQSARMNSGYYSSFRVGGAVPGFTFESEVKARAFLEVALGQFSAQPVSAAEGDATADLDARMTPSSTEEEVATAGSPSPDVLAEHRTAEGDGLVIGSGAQVSLVAPASAVRLDAVAERLEAAARQLTRADRLVNTPKRAAEAERAAKSAHAKTRLATTVRNIARSIREGEARYLGDLRDGSQVEFLDLLVRMAHHAYLRSIGSPIQQADDESDVAMDCVDFAEMPSFSVHSHQIHGLIRALEKEKGCGRLRQRLRALAEAAAPDNAPLQFANAVDARQCIQILGKTTRRDALPWHWVQASERLGRLERLGVRRVEHLRAVLREFMRCRAGSTTDLASRIRAAELALVGKQVGVDFFPTPKALAQRMVEMSGVKPGMRALDPQAGAGAIADELRAAGALTTVCELSYELRRLLLLKGYELCGEEDFLQFIPEEKFPVIVSNPPFGGNADIKHFLHAYDKALAPGGNLVSIIGEGAFSRTGQVERGFQDQLTKLGAHVERLPAGTFSDRSLLNTTGANARLVMVKKL